MAVLHAAAAVATASVPVASALGSTGGVRNRVEIETDRLGWIGIEGPGAGGAATGRSGVMERHARSHAATPRWQSTPRPSRHPSGSPSSARRRSCS